MIIVTLHKTSNVDSFANDLNGAGYAFQQMTALRNIYIVEDVDSQTFSLAGHPSVRSVEDDNEDAELCAVSVQNISLDATTYKITGDAWALPRICRRKAPWSIKRPEKIISTDYQYARTGQGVDIYIYDTGIRGTEDDFSGRAFNLDGSVADNYSTGHGHYVAGCAAGARYGVAKEATIWDVLWSTNAATRVTEINDILNHYQGRSGLDRPAVFNGSYGGIGATTAELDAIDTLIDAGIICCFAAGNFRNNTDFEEFWPATGVDDCVAVGGTAMNDTMFYDRRYGTSYGQQVDIYAPSQYSESTPPAGNRSGTSFGSPYTAGVLACMLQGYRRLTSRAQVQALKAKLLVNATQGAIDFTESMNGAASANNNNRMLYLDPYIEFEEISGLVPIGETQPLP